MSSVLDASAALAVIQNEPGSDRVNALLSGDGGVICSVNLAEVAAKLIDLGYPEAEVGWSVALPGLTVLPFDESLALVSARLRSATRRLGLSLGDRACLALGLTTGLPVLTADRAWSQLDIGVAVEVIR